MNQDGIESTTWFDQKPTHGTPQRGNQYSQKLVDRAMEIWDEIDHLVEEGLKNQKMPDPELIEFLQGCAADLEKFSKWGLFLAISEDEQLRLKETSWMLALQEEYQEYKQLENQENQEPPERCFLYDDKSLLEYFTWQCDCKPTNDIPCFPCREVARLRVKMEPQNDEIPYQGE